ncbi:MAG TPA: HlyD family type I secretion periplasmic adaptor subunit [Alphaproteobacteria bacterium]|nr:HlyD family type I secretion periplasmic adaptor subunit [Alphaproteobacteria bacterium]
MNLIRSIDSWVERLRRRGGQSQRRFLAQSALLEDAEAPEFLRLGVLSILVILVAFLGWAAATRIEEVALGVGEIVPSGSVRIVQHLEGGIVGEIRVEEGQVVRAGETLVRLDPTAALAELEQMRSREASLALKAERLRAFAEAKGAPPEFGRLSADERYAGLVQDQSAILVLQAEALDQQRRTIEREIAGTREEYTGLARRKDALEREVAFAAEKLAMHETLMSEGLTSKTRYLDAARDLERAKGELAGIEAEMRANKEAVAELLSEIDEAIAKQRAEAMNERGQVTAELAEVREAIERLEDRVRRLNITSPAHGVVQALAVKSVGAVIAPGQAVLEIVPDEALVVEARLKPRDIGHVAAGQPVSIRVASYDFVRFGAVEGTLERVSATTFQDEDGVPYYRARIRLAQSYLGEQPGRHLLLPGMTVEAAIKTGERSLITYLLRPVRRAFQSGLGER